MQQGLMHLDWSKDSQVLIVNSQYQEVKYVSLKDLAALPPQQTQKYQTEWNTYTSKFGFPSQGVFNDSNYA
jgi:hypothetical protein